MRDSDRSKSCPFSVKGQMEINRIENSLQENNDDLEGQRRRVNTPFKDNIKYGDEDRRAGMIERGEQILGKPLSRDNIMENDFVNYPVKYGLEPDERYPTDADKPEVDEQNQASSTQIYTWDEVPPSHPHGTLYKGFASTPLQSRMGQVHFSSWLFGRSNLDLVFQPHSKGTEDDSISQLTNVQPSKISSYAMNVYHTKSLNIKAVDTLPLITGPQRSQVSRPNTVSGPIPSQRGRYSTPSMPRTEGSSRFHMIPVIDNPNTTRFNTVTSIGNALSTRQSRITGTLSDTFSNTGSNLGDYNKNGVNNSGNPSMSVIGTKNLHGINSFVFVGESYYYKNGEQRSPKRSRLNVPTELLNHRDGSVSKIMESREQERRNLPGPGSYDIPGGFGMNNAISPVNIRGFRPPIL